MINKQLVKQTVRMLLNLIFGVIIRWVDGLIDRYVK